MKQNFARGRLRGAVAAATLVALCVYMPQRAAAQQANNNLAGSTWRLVSLTMADHAALPSDQMKYTLTFQKNGVVVVRADCNRGSGRYMDPPMGALQIGPITLSKAHCPPGSLADQFARAIGFTQSYEIRDGQLLLGVAPGGDTLRFERSATKGR